MILGIDVGGTKTLLGLFNNQGDLKRTHHTLTNDNYHDFVPSLSDNITSFLKDEPVETISLAMPGTIDHATKSVVSLGHRPWKNVAIVDDLRSQLNFSGRMLLENDAKLAGLAEAMSYPELSVVVYVTISTGIGVAIIVDGALDRHFAGDEGGFMIVPHGGSFRFWDHIASGAAFYEKYGALAAEVNDPVIWQEHATVLAPGFSAIHALLTPDLVITGGGLGSQLHKFEKPLLTLLNLPGSTIAKPPRLAAAKYGDKSVLYGCYELAKQPA